MPRTPRQYSSTGIYHIILRGVNRQNIFFDDIDHHKFLSVLDNVIDNTDVYLLGYCLMINHAHLLIQDSQNNISQIMKRIGTSYARWFNRRHNRVGHVFQDRFRSENIEDDAYLKTVIRYIHQNPVKAGMISKAEDYPWSSCRNYYSNDKDGPISISVSLILELFNTNRNDAIEEFNLFMNENNYMLEVIESKRLSDSDALLMIKRVIKNLDIKAFSTLPIKERNLLLRELKSVKGLSLRQIARLTSLGYQTVYRA